MFRYATTDFGKNSLWGPTDKLFKYSKNDLVLSETQDKEN